MKTTLMITTALLGLGAIPLAAAPAEDGAPPPGGRRPAFEQLDANQDGVIDRTEWEAMRTRVANRRGGPPGRGPQGPGPGPGAEPGPRQHLRQHVLDRFDADEDGRLNREERGAAHESLAGRRQGPGGPQGLGPAGPRGPRGFGGPAGSRGGFERPPFVDRFDANDDGVLDDSEWQAFRKHVEERMEQRQDPPPGRPGQD